MEAYAGFAAAWTAAGAWATAQLLRNPLLVRKTLGVHPPVPVAVDLVLLIVAWLAGLAVGVALTGGKTAKRAIRRRYRAQRDEVVATVKSTWATRWVLLFQYLAVGAIIAGGVVGWRAFCLFANSVVVLSGSMETAFYRGDLLFLTNWEWDPIVPGEIVVFKIPGRDIPIVHRVHQVHQSSNYSDAKLLTKGDNNNVHDRGLYAYRQLWLGRRQIIGRARFFVPYIGMVTIALNEYWFLKAGLISAMILQVLISREV